MTNSPFTVEAELVYDAATDRLYGIEAPDPGLPAPGDRLQHRSTHKVGTVLNHDGVAWPAGIDSETWRYVRFDAGFNAYVPLHDLAPQNGVPYYGWPGSRRDA